MKKITKRVLASLLASILVLSSLAGCKPAAPSVTDPAGTASTASGTEPTVAEEITLPIVPVGEKVTLKYFIPFSSEVIPTLEENTMYQELEKRTNVDIEWIHPAGDANQAFQLMIASNDLPDLMEDCLANYPGGLDKLIEEEIALPLNDLVAKYAPNYSKIRAEYPSIAKETITDTGKLGAFYCVQTEQESPWDGMRLRQDWLDELKLETPTTIDELTNVLREFKSKKNASAPMVWYDGWKDQYGYIIGAWDIGPKFFNEKGTVKYGPATPAYKEYVETMRTWVSEGLLDKEYLTREAAGREELISKNQTGVFNNTTAKELQSVVKPVPYLTKTKGATRHFSNWVSSIKPANEVIITTACKNPEIATKWLDYHYTEEGSFLFNYGVEGISYEEKDGKPQFTEIMTNNPDGIAPIYMCYVHKWHQGAYNRDYMAMPGMDEKYIKEMECWETNTDGAYVMPPITMTSDEGTKFANIMSDVNTYVDEMTNKFILGIEPMDKYDKFVEQINGMDLESAVKVQQAALDRFLAR